MAAPDLHLLALADIHADEEALDGLRALASRQSYDAVLMAGDLTNRGPISYAQDLIDLFGERFYFVHGNMDSSAVVDLLRPQAGYLHGRKLPIGEWNLVGLGGSNPTPFQTPSELIGASPQLQASVRGAQVGALQPTITGAREATQTFREQLQSFKDVVGLLASFLWMQRQLKIKPEMMQELLLKIVSVYSEVMHLN